MNKSIIGILGALMVIFLGASAAAADYTAAQVALHNTDANCLVIVDGGVYNLTLIVVWHANIITCGADNTQAYINHHSTLGTITPYLLGNVITSVPDTTAPVITLNGANPANVTQNHTYTDAGATAVDNVDGPVSVQKTGTVNTAAIGTYIITYTAKDAANNTATKTRTVNVKAAPATPAPDTNTTNTTAPKLKYYTAAQISVHDTSNDCWVYVFRNVYNVTAVMSDYGDFYICGKNNTANWQASIFGNDTSIMNPFLIGKLKNSPKINKIKHGKNNREDGDDHASLQHSVDKENEKSEKAEFENKKSHKNRAKLSLGKIIRKPGLSPDAKDKKESDDD